MLINVYHVYVLNLLLCRLLEIISFGMYLNFDSKAIQSNMLMMDI
jgi:hypothetical protein